MKRNFIEGHGINGIKVELSIREAELIKDRVRFIKDHEKACEETPRAELEFDDRKKRDEDDVTAERFAMDLINLFDKITKDVPATRDVEKELFGVPEAAPVKEE